MRNFITQNIENIQLSLKLSTLISLIPSLVFPSITNWLINNIDYVSIALGSIALDHLLGSYVHLKIKKDWDFKKNITGFGIKVSMVVAFGFIMEGLAHLTIEDDLVYRYIKMVGRLLVIFYPSLSAMKNMKIITNGAFPPDAIIGKIENFNKEMDLKDFKEKPNENQ